MFNCNYTHLTQGKYCLNFIKIILLTRFILFGIILYIRSLFKSFRRDKNEFKGRIGKLKSTGNEIRNSMADIIEKTKEDRRS